MIVVIGTLGGIYTWLLFNEETLVNKLVIVGMLWVILLLYVQVVEKFTV